LGLAAQKLPEGFLSVAVKRVSRRLESAGFHGIFLSIGKREMAIDSPVKKAWEYSPTAVPFSTIRGVGNAKKYRLQGLVFSA